VQAAGLANLASAGRRRSEGIQQALGGRDPRARREGHVWNDFLSIFDIERRQVAKFEPVVQRYSTGRAGFIDLLWPGRLLVEHKSSGEDLEAAIVQAMDYLPAMDEADVPRLVVACDFANFVVRDLGRPGEELRFGLDDLADNLEVFGFLVGRDRVFHETEEDVNLAATELLARVDDSLKAAKYDDHQRRVLLTRILFCLFADDAQVWPRGLFFDFLLLRTREDGQDLGPQLEWLFQILNTPPDRRAENLPACRLCMPQAQLELQHLSKRRLPLVCGGRLRSVSDAATPSEIIPNQMMRGEEESLAPPR